MPISTRRAARRKKMIARRWRKPVLRVMQIVAWADEYFEKSGHWPKRTSGRVSGTDETWGGVHAALSVGLRGLPGGDSLARLLARHRGVRNIAALPRLTVAQILAWADEHFQRTGRWPTVTDGSVFGTDETWVRIDGALGGGLRGLPGGDSLPRLLARHRGVRNSKALPHLTSKQILAWADAHFASHKRWPTSEFGDVEQAAGETWSGIDAALWHGTRGLPGGCSLARFLGEHRNVRNRNSPPALSVDEILAWGDAHFDSRRSWPTAHSGAIADAPGETWAAIDIALRRGTRSLKGKSSLSRLWRTHRGLRKRPYRRRLSEEEILAWADAFHARHGHWPNRRSGTVLEAPDIDWLAINTALRDGRRGLKKGGSSLPRFLLRQRGVRTQACAPPLTVAEVLSWADAHFSRHSAWPNTKSGRVECVPGESWASIHQALKHGYRGLPGGFTLATFLDRYRRNRRKK